MYETKSSTSLILETGRLFVFGSNDWGQLGLGHKNHISKPSCVKGPYRSLF